jgi:ABC-2 type transport system permease protein
MIATLLKISRTSLSRDRAAQVMVFVLPIVFFSIFAMIFGRMGSNSTPRVELVVVDEDRSDMSTMLREAMRADEGLMVHDSTRAEGGPKGALVPITREKAQSMVRAGDFPIAVVIPKGWGATFPNLNGQGMKVDVIADVSDPVGRHVIVGILQRCAAVVMRGGPDAVAAAEQAGTAPAGPMSLVATNVIDLMGDPKRQGRMVSFYAAGIGVMFLLFSCAGAGGALLEEQDSGTLERVISTRAGMRGLLLGKWLHITVTGVLQILVMFVWGMLVFKLDLLSHLPGFAIMTVFTAGAAAALGLVLATASRTRQQLQGYANMVILPMSALGGSMFPRFLMSPAMQKVGLVTFNAWALDGYLKVFWRELPLTSLAPQVGVLAGLTIVFLTIARMLARKWEAA